MQSSDSRKLAIVRGACRRSYSSVARRNDTSIVSGTQTAAQLMGEGVVDNVTTTARTMDV